MSQDTTKPESQSADAPPSVESLEERVEHVENELARTTGLLVFVLAAVATVAACGAIWFGIGGAWLKALLLGAVAVSAISGADMFRKDRDLHDDVLGTFLRTGPAGWLAIIWGTIPAIGGLMLLASIKPASAWLNDLGGAGVAVYVALFVVAAGIGLLPTFAQAAVGGWAFGMAIGMPAALAGFTGAAVVGYALARLASRDRVEQIIAERPKFRAVREALIGGGFWRTWWIVTLLRVPPNSPFAVTNLLMASSGTRLLPYILGTAIGMAPRTVVAVYIADQVRRTIADDQEVDLSARWVQIFGVVSLVVVLVVIGKIANRALERASGVPADPAD